MKLFSRLAALTLVILALAAFTANPVVYAKEYAGSDKKTSDTKAKVTKKNAKKANKPDSATIKAVQEALVAAGYKLKVDGNMGRTTKIALKKYQKKMGIKATGRIDKATIEKMAIEPASGT